MSSSVTYIRNKVPGCCRATRCHKDKCGLGLKDTPTNRVIVDMDCTALNLSNTIRCDYAFFNEDNGKVQVVPIELKGGKVGSVTHVASQLQGGADQAERLFPDNAQPRCTPVLAHKKPIHRDDLHKLRKARIRLGGRSWAIQITRCGGQLLEVLQREPESA